MLPWEYVGILRVLFLHEYAMDSAFTRRLYALWEAHGGVVAALVTAPWRIDWWHIRFQYGKTRPPTVQAYFDALNALAKEFGLDNFMSSKNYRESMSKSYPNTSVPLAGELSFFGYEAIHRWCKQKACDPHFATYNFGLMPYSGDSPEVSEIVERRVYELSVPLHGEVITERFVDERRAPVLNVPGGERWYGRDELYRDAKKRLLAIYGEKNTRLIAAELDRLRDAFEEVGYTFPDTQPSLYRHLRWLYRRVRYCESCEKIAYEASQERDPDADDTEWMKESTVRKATNRLKTQIGINTPRPNPSRKKEACTKSPS